MDSLSKRNQEEFCTTGKQLQLPLLVRCALITSHKASRITWHSHECFEILMVIEGATEYEFEDGHLQSLVGGQFISIAPGVLHRGKHNVRSPARLLGILFDPSVKNGTYHSPFTKKEFSWLSQQIQQGAGRARRFNADVRWHLKSIASLMKNFDADPLSLISMRLSVCTLLLEVARQFSSVDNLEPTRVVKSAMEYMQKNLCSEMSIEAVAKAASCSRASLFTLFKESTGMTPNDYWLRIRIEHAQVMLRTTDWSITDVAMQSGFSTGQYFSSVFKKYSGTTPRDYRHSR